MLERETGHSYQMMDTPGLLSRPDEKRNEMECLTLVHQFHWHLLNEFTCKIRDCPPHPQASMQHLPTAVVFVLDLRYDDFYFAESVLGCFIVFWLCSSHII